MVEHSSIDYKYNKFQCELVIQIKPTQMYHDIYTVISSYLTDFDIIKSLSRLEHESTGLTRREDLAKKVNEQPLTKRFVYSASMGYKDGLIKYYDVDRVNKAFRESCGNGHMEIAKWLHGLGNVNTHANNDSAFRLSCEYGHLETAQWLYSLGGVNIHVENDEAFSTSCEYGHLETAKWLYSLGNVNIHVYNDGAFRWSCSNGSLETAQWLYGLGGVNIHACYDYAFKSSHPKIVEWLNTLP